VWNIPEAQYHRSVGTLTEMLGLEDIWKVTARELSLGQKMRADLALALLPEPELVLLDEPTLGLDVLAKRHVLEFCREINRTRGVTIIITSHDLSDLEALAGRMVMVHHGQIAFDGEFEGLRTTVGLQRRLRLVTDGIAPVLDGATYLDSRDGAHEYAYDVSVTTLPELLAQAEARSTVLDVETHRPPIDDVIATLYESWTRKRDQGAVP
jgi:ABC-2 type transport system ATP-binding protein